MSDCRVHNSTPRLFRTSTGMCEFSHLFCRSNCHLFVSCSTDSLDLGKNPKFESTFCQFQPGFLWLPPQVGGKEQVSGIFFSHAGCNLGGACPLVSAASRVAPPVSLCHVIGQRPWLTRRSIATATANGQEPPLPCAVQAGALELSLCHLKGPFFCTHFPYSVAYLCVLSKCTAVHMACHASHIYCGLPARGPSGPTGSALNFLFSNGPVERWG